MNFEIENILPQIMNGGNWTFHLIFYRIPKNASTSIFNHLGDLNLIKKHHQKFAENCDQKLYRGWFDPAHAKPSEAFRILGHEIGNYKSFCVVRNPWDRAVSMYKFAEKENLKELYQIKVDHTFENFCDILQERQDDPYFIATHKQVDWLQGIYPPKTILRYETLNEDFPNMLKDFGALHISPQLPHLNQTKHSHYSDYYNENTKRIIGKIFEKDVDAFKYTFETEKKDLTKKSIHHKIKL
jgi:hypothetical protein